MVGPCYSGIQKKLNPELVLTTSSFIFTFSRSNSYIKGIATRKNLGNLLKVEPYDVILTKLVLTYLKICKRGMTLLVGGHFWGVPHLANHRLVILGKNQSSDSVEIFVCECMM